MQLTFALELPAEYDEMTRVEWAASRLEQAARHIRSHSIPGYERVLDDRGSPIEGVFGTAFYPPEPK